MDKMITWHDVLAEEKKKSYFVEMLMMVEKERALGKKIYPPKRDVFNAFSFTELYQVKVVIIGQDPYHGPGQANGLAFSIRPGVTVPPSLKNIYKELENDIPGFQQPNHGVLESWAKQGVLLLNTVLTVEEGKANSHAHFGWEIFTDRVMSVINEEQENTVFLLWGSHAQKKGRIINIQRNFVLRASHPSPFSANRGFFGCRHFSRTNEILYQLGKSLIDWTPRLN